MTTSANDDIEVIERIDARGRHVIEIREKQAPPGIPNDMIFGAVVLTARRQGLEAIGNFETGEVTFRPIGKQQ